MMLGAHERGEAWIATDRTGLDTVTPLSPVHALLSNYQDLFFPAGDSELSATFENIPLRTSSGRDFSGFLRLMTFDTVTGLVDIQTISPRLNPLPFGPSVPPGRDVDVPSARSTDGNSLVDVLDTNNALLFRAIPTSILTDRTATNIDGIGFAGYVNLPPTASGVTITDNNGGSAEVGDTLTGAYSYNDLDGDADNSSFRWLRNGLAIAGASGRNYTLAAADAS